MTTEYHSLYYAHQLTRRLSSDNAEKLSQSLLNATVDLNPHQVEAALFAFQSPLSRGAVLADEVGLGKTIEAGLIISQLWAERKRRISASFRHRFASNGTGNFWKSSSSLRSSWKPRASTRSGRNTAGIPLNRTAPLSSAPTSSQRQRSTKWRKSIGIWS